MKVRLELFFALLLFSCVYDPPQKGKQVFIHNQTDKSFLVIDSLTGSYFKLYDTAEVNGSVYITRKPNFVTEFGVFQSFYSEGKINNIRNKRNGKIGLYSIEHSYLRDAPSVVLTNHSYRYFESSVDTLKKYELNHLFLKEETILFEHHQDYYTIWK